VNALTPKSPGRRRIRAGCALWPFSPCRRILAMMLLARVGTPPAMAQAWPAVPWIRCWCRSGKRPAYTQAGSAQRQDSHQWFRIPARRSRIRNRRARFVSPSWALRPLLLGVSSDEAAWPHVVWKTLTELNPHQPMDYVNASVPGYAMEKYRHKLGASRGGPEPTSW